MGIAGRNPHQLMGNAGDNPHQNTTAGGTPQEDPQHRGQENQVKGRRMAGEKAMQDEEREPDTDTEHLALEEDPGPYTENGAGGKGRRRREEDRPGYSAEGGQDDQLGGPEQMGRLGAGRNPHQLMGITRGDPHQLMRVAGGNPHQQMRITRGNPHQLMQVTGDNPHQQMRVTGGNPHQLMQVTGGNPHQHALAGDLDQEAHQDHGQGNQEGGREVEEQEDHPGRRGRIGHRIGGPGPAGG